MDNWYHFLFIAAGTGTSLVSSTSVETAISVSKTEGLLESIPLLSVYKIVWCVFVAAGVSSSLIVCISSASCCSKREYDSSDTKALLFLC